MWISQGQAAARRRGDELSTHPINENTLSKQFINEMRQELGIRKLKIKVAAEIATSMRI